jgi:hypothetical protein
MLWGYQLINYPSLFQCLVKGCHKRLRIVHTIELNEGGANIQIVRIAVYEEKWVSPAHIHVEE